MKRSVRVQKTSPMLPETPGLSTAEFEAWVVSHADYFTLTFKVGPGEVQRQEHETLTAAIAKRAGNPRGMVYAVMNSGRSVMIAPTQYDQFLILRGEKAK